MIPIHTSPLTKAIRTLEGVLVVAANITLVVVPIVTNSLSASTAVKYGAILNAVFVASRTVLKSVSLASGVTGITPDGFGKGAQALPADVAALASQVAPQVAQLWSVNKIDPTAVVTEIGQDVPDAEKIVGDAQEFAAPVPDPTATPEPSA